MKKALARDDVPAPSGGALWETSTIRRTILEDVYVRHGRADLDALVAEGVLAREVADRTATPCGIAYYNRRKTTTRPVMVGGERKKQQKEEVRPRAGWIAVP